MSKLILIAAAAALSMAGPAAMAQSVNGSIDVRADEVPTQVVHTDGVDFNNPRDVRRLYFKVWSAAQSVCNSGSANSVLVQYDMGCARRAMADAIHSANKPSLTAMYDANASSTSSFASR